MDPKYLSKLLVDEYVMKILMASFKTPMSTQEMSLEFNIPIAVCYRKVRELMAAGLLTKDKKELTQQGKWVQLYRSKLKGAYVFLEHGELRVRMETTDAHEPEMDRSVSVLDDMEELVA
jgi:predicted transcriptional regulator